MNVTGLKAPGMRSIYQDEVPLCPACGGVMEESDRVTENGSTYIWYDCPLPDCDGQWLDKRPAKAG
jgi:hypothetical protein